MLGMTLVRQQSGREGRLVKRLLVEEGADIAKELYVGMVVDRATQRVTLMASSEGGMEIEEVAARTPEKICKVAIDPDAGLTDAQADTVAARIGVPAAALAEARWLLKALYRAFDESDASLAEINPLVLTGDGRVVALDAKLGFDPNALYRQPDILAWRDLDEEDAAEVEASGHGLSSIALDGDIGCLVNAAGLAMAPMDAIKLFGGIMRCDTIAEGVVAAAREVDLAVPLVVRMKGTNEERGKEILKASGLPIIAADNMADAARKIVAAVRTELVAA